METFPQEQPPGGSGGPRVALVVVAVVVVLGLLGLGIFLVTTGGDDSGDDGDDTVEAASDDSVDEEADLDDDGIPDAEDDDIDGDHVPDEEDEAPLDPDIPNEGGGDDNGDHGDGEEPPEATSPPEEPSPPDETDPPTEETDPPAQGYDLLRESPTPAIDAWLEAAGDNAKAIEVVLYTEYGFATLRDPDRPNDVQRWGWRDGVVDGPEDEEPFPGTDLEAEQFRLDRPNWDALPRLVANAPERAHLPQGHVTHVIVTSDLPFSDRKIFRIYVEAPNGSDYVVATIDGDPVDR